jgi:predicted DNA-binding transcriptional regulator AlpA
MSSIVLRTRQAAERVGLSAATLEKYRLTGNGPPYQKAGPKIVVYRSEDLDEWLTGNRRRSTSDTGPITAAEVPRPHRRRPRRRRLRGARP